MGNDVDNGEQYTKFRSPGYNKKTYFKTNVMLEALEIGLCVLFVDADCAFLKNPIPYLKNYTDTDIANTQVFYTWGRHVHNSGHYFANPTAASIELHRKMSERQKFQGKSNQVIMNTVIKEILKDDIKVVRLNTDHFFDAYYYFKKKCCQFAFDRCCPYKNAVILHNNLDSGMTWMKIYRFKEHLLWQVDTNRYVCFTANSLHLLE